MRLIDADALIKQIEDTICKPCRKRKDDYKGVRCRACQYGDEKDDIDSAPSAQRWILCSERYPDMDERVLVYTVAHEYHVWDCMSNRADNYFWEDEDGLYHDKYVVDLWMPLPKPYKGDANEQ